MSDGKRPTKGTLRLTPQAAKEANAPAKTASQPKTQSAKSGARRVAAAAARGERLLPAVPVAGADEGERGRRPGKAAAGGRGAAPGGPRKPAGDAGQDRPRDRSSQARQDGRPEFRGKPRPAGAGGRSETDGGAGRDGERRGGRPSAAGDNPWRTARPAGDSRGQGREGREGRDGREGRADTRRPAAEREPSARESGGDGMDVWAQARANLAARARQSASERPPRREPKFPPKAPVKTPAKPSAAEADAPAVRSTSDNPLYDANGVRVSKLLAEQGLCSRREADAYIERGWVLVDGERVTELGLRVSPTARVTLAPEAHAAQTQQVTILLHKPVGYVSGQPEGDYAPAASLIGPANQVREGDEPVFHMGMLRGLAPAGRLDIDSTGLLVLTQDGRIARQLIGEDTKIDKEYMVRVEGELIENGLALLNHGLSLDDQPLRPARVEWINDDQLRFVLREGRKRQIRRMCELVGLRVVGLKRVRIGKVRLGDLPSGSWRLLRAGETF